MRYEHPSTTEAHPMAANQLPIFVYGTLRNGQPNYSWALAGRTTDEQTASLDDAEMYGLGRGFPYVAPGQGTVHGELMYIAAEHFSEVLATLDRLEGYQGPGLNNHYDRLIRSIRLDDGSHVEAWVYLIDPERASRFSGFGRINTGDWLNQSPASEACS